MARQRTLLDRLIHNRHRSNDELKHIINEHYYVQSHHQNTTQQHNMRIMIQNEQQQLRRRCGNHKRRTNSSTTRIGSNNNYYYISGIRNGMFYKIKIPSTSNDHHMITVDATETATTTASDSPSTNKFFLPNIPKIFSLQLRGLKPFKNVTTTEVLNHNHETTSTRETAERSDDVISTTATSEMLDTKSPSSTSTMTEKQTTTQSMGVFDSITINSVMTTNAATATPPTTLNINASSSYVTNQNEQQHQQHQEQNNNNDNTNHNNTNNKNNNEEFWNGFHVWWKTNYATLILNIGSICTLVGFTRSDILELRTCSVTGSLCAVIFNLSLKPFHIAPVLWSSTFAFVNSYKIYEIILERNGSVQLTNEQQERYVTFFLPNGITPKQFDLIDNTAQKLLIHKGSYLIKQNQPINHVYLIVRGQTRATTLGRYLTAVSMSSSTNDGTGGPQQATGSNNNNDTAGGSSGAWIGEMEFFQYLWEKQQQQQQQQQQKSRKNNSKIETVSPELDVTNDDLMTSTIANIAKDSNSDGNTNINKKIQLQTKKNSNLSLYSVIAQEDCYVLCWSFDQMDELMNKSPDMKAGLTRAMTSAIVGKVINFTVSRSNNNNNDDNNDTNTLSSWTKWFSGSSSISNNETMINHNNVRLNHFKVLSIKNSNDGVNNNKQQNEEVKDKGNEIMKEMDRDDDDEENSHDEKLPNMPMPQFK